MSKIITFFNMLKHDRRGIKKAFVANFIKSPISHLFSDKFMLSVQYKATFCRKINLSDPKTFSEKLQWLKLYDRNPFYTTLVDKYAVKEYISNTIGEEYVIPNYGVWDSFEGIDFDSLPNQFVLKCTHDSGSVIICKDKSTFDYEKARKKLLRGLKRNLFWHCREWQYKNVKPRILAEKYMEDAETAELRDYKFFCFNGVAKAMFIATDRQKTGEEVKFDFFDMNFNHLPFCQGHPNAKELPQKPEMFDKMKELAEKLSENIPHVRVDFYEVNSKVYFGELTFSHFAGMMPFEPEEWDCTFGSWINLPTKK